MTDIILFMKNALHTDIVLQLCIWAVVTDTIFGFMRAVKQHKFNSCFGIDGAIRKTTMILSLAFLVMLDYLTGFDLLKFVPAEIVGLMGLTAVGTADFFGLMYLAYETVSILKNITLCGANTEGIYKSVRRFLSKYTTELPDEN